MTASSPEELETLLEDAILLGDAAALRALCGRGSVVVRGSQVSVDLGLLARPGYVAAATSATLLRHDLALVASERGVNVSARGADGAWRLVATVLHE